MSTAELQAKFAGNPHALGFPASVNVWGQDPELDALCTAYIAADEAFHRASAVHRERLIFSGRIDIGLALTDRLRDHEFTAYWDNGTHRVWVGGNNAPGTLKVRDLRQGADK